MLSPTAPQLDALSNPELHASGGAHEIWRWMREHAPVHWHEPCELPGYWSLTRHSEIRAVYRDPATFSSAAGVLLRRQAHGRDPGAGLTLALTDPTRHTELRAILAPSFDERCARGFADAMRTAAVNTINDAVAAGECDLAQDIGARLAVFLVAHLLGVPESDHAELGRWTHEAFETGRALTGHQEFMSYLIGLMVDRMQTPVDDTMSRLVTGTADGELLSETEILLNCENLVGAAENAGLSIAAGVFAFMNHPEQFGRLRVDRSLLSSAVEEVLRWTSSATHSMRTATRAVELAGQSIAAGDRVVLWIPSANRDDAEFAEPYRFDISRKPNRHLALGAGAHVCIGGTMARHQMRLFFGELLDSVARVEQLGPAVPLRSIAVNGLARLPVRLHPASTMSA